MNAPERSMSNRGSGILAFISSQSYEQLDCDRGMAFAVRTIYSYDDTSIVNTARINLMTCKKRIECSNST